MLMTDSIAIFIPYLVLFLLFCSPNAAGKNKHNNQSIHEEGGDFKTNENLIKNTAELLQYSQNKNNAQNEWIFHATREGGFFVFP